MPRMNLPTGNGHAPESLAPPREAATARPGAQAPKLDVDTCPVCAGSSWSTLFTSRGFPIARCTGCGLARTLDVPPDSGVHYPPFDQRETALVRLLRTS